MIKRGDSMDEIKVNDGKGLLDNIGLINSLIEDCDNLAACLFSGQRILFCGQLVQMVQKLGNLREGVKADLADKDRQIKELQERGETDGVEH